MKIRIEERTRNRQIFRIPRFTDYSAAVFYALCAILCLGNFLHVQALTPKGVLLMERKPVHDFLLRIIWRRHGENATIGLFSSDKRNNTSVFLCYQIVLSYLCGKSKIMDRHIFFSHKEELWNSWSHFGGIVLGAVVAFVLLHKASATGDSLNVAAVALYIAGMLSSYISSTVYHSLSAWSVWKERLRKVDHAAIYWHIAGSYSPVTLIALRHEGYWGWGLFTFVWLCAITGTIISFHKLKSHSNLETLSFLGMGFSVLVALKPLLDAVSMTTFWWIIAEGICYIAGATFYTLHKHRYNHTVFHFFVIAGTICHIVAVWYILVDAMV